MKFSIRLKRIMTTLLVVTMVAMFFGGATVFAAGGRGKGNSGGRHLQSQNQNQTQATCKFDDCLAFTGEGCDLTQNNCTCPYRDNKAGCARQVTGTPKLNNPDCLLINYNNGNNNTNLTSFNQNNPICPDCGDKLFVGSISRNWAKQGQKILCENGYSCTEHFENSTYKVVYRSSNCAYFYETEAILSKRNCRRF